MISQNDDENYTVFLTTLDKDQLLRLALINRQQCLEHRTRYLRLRSAALYETPEEVKALTKSFEQDSQPVEIPDDINYMRFVEQNLWK